MPFRRLLSAALLLAVCFAPVLRAGESARELQRQGVLLDNQGKSDEALQKLRQAVASDGNDYSCRLALGTVAMKAGRYDEARVSLEKAAELEPNSPSAHYGLAMLYEKAKDPRAKSEWEKILQLSPDASMKEIAQRHLGRLGPQ